jgi:hypothetical protein
MSEIKAFAMVYESIPDRYGNCYYAAQIVRTSDGATAMGTISGNQSNVSYALRVMFPDNYSWVVVVPMPIRQWNRLAAGLPRLGCTSDEINAKVLELWGGAK